MQDIDYVLRRGVAEVIVKEELEKLFRSGKKLRLKEGFDPSFPDIHLGHMVGLRKLRQFQELGHQVVLIVADWTAQIGDPSGVSITRPMITREKVVANAQTYIEQFSKIVDPKKTEIRWQSEWYDKFTLTEVIRLASKFTVAQLMAREDFSARYSSGRPITMAELLYPILQAYDSVAVQADVEFGGTDQKFNLLCGRELQSMMGQPPQQIFMVPLLVGTDGKQKMSKSLGNYVGVAEPPNEIYGKLMSVPDSLVLQYCEILTDVSDKELAEFKEGVDKETLNPMELKKRLAREMVAQLYDREQASKAEEYFTKVFQKKELPDEIRQVKMTPELLEKIKPVIEVARIESDGRHLEGHYVSVSLLLIEAGLAKSRTEAKRLIAQGSVDIDDNTIIKDGWIIKIGSIIKVGRRRFVKLVSPD